MVFSSTASAQCGCKSEFAFLHLYVEKNYPGFQDKIPTYFGKDYQKMTKEYERKAAKENNTAYCMLFMKEWLSYFKDNHLRLGTAKTDANDSLLLTERRKKAERINITPKITDEIKQSTGVEGVYYNDDSVYKVAIIKSPNSWRTYAAVVLETKSKKWAPGMVKFELAEKNDSTKYEGKWFTNYPCLFYYEDHSFAGKIFSFSGYGLDGGIWKKEGLKESAEEQALRDKWKTEPSKKERPSPIAFSKPANNCAYLRINSFNSSLIAMIDSMVLANDSVIGHTPYLIIDIRNNGGGSDYGYKTLIPYLYTDPIVSPGISILATDNNIEAVQRAMTSVTVPEIKQGLENKIKNMQLYRWRFTPAVNDTLVLDSVKRYPEKIAILVNGNCASAAEEFLLEARQSTKVTIIGQPTNGTLDYSNKCSQVFPCMPYILEYPISRSGRLPQNPIDNIGIKPDISIKGDVDWIQTALRYLQMTKRD